MAEDWDLYAIVRAGYKSAATSSSTTPSETSPITATAISSSQETLSCVANLTFNEENEPFSFPNLVQPRTDGFQELHQLFTSFIPTTTIATTATVTSGFGRINPNSPFSDFSGSIGQQQEHQLHHHPPPPPVLSTSNHSSVKPHFMPETSTSGFERFHDQQQQQQLNQLRVVQQQEFQVSPSSSAMSLQNTQTQTSTPRSRKRKSQQKRMVCHVTADNLSSDLWAWRKYGQKPIKGSPYPRNYYRCSSSKGCAARKQVERSTTEPDMFIVTYTGDHTHPRPTHRNSLAGSTRNKPSTTQKLVPHGSGSPSNPSGGPSSSSPLSPSSVSPRTPLTAQHEQGEAEDSISANETESPDPDLELNLGDDDDDDILIPNMQAAMADDIFFGIDQLVDDAGGGDTSGNPQVG